MQAGVRIDFAHIRYGLHNAKAMQPVIDVCKRYNIAIIGDEATLYGCVDEAFVGIPCPSHFQSDPSVPSVAAVRGVVHQMGGWATVQKALAAVQEVACKHGVSMQSVALRWSLDNGVSPVVLTPWSHPGACMGKGALADGPPADAPLFQRSTFLDSEDMYKLSAVAC